MLPELAYAAIRFENLVNDQLIPAAFPERAALSIEVFQSRGRPPLADVQEAARAGRFKPVQLGWRWGPAWSTAWFRVRGRVPASMRGAAVALRFSPGSEALLWVDGVPRQGFDDNRDLAFLFHRARGGEVIDLFVEAACNMPLGVSTFWWEPREVHARWRERNPGRLDACELVSFDRSMWEFSQRVDFARMLMGPMPQESAIGRRLDEGLREIAARIDGHDPRRSLPALRRDLDSLLAGRGAAAAHSRCTAIGHAHIDTAWLWPLAETRRKCMRTFASVLRLMERFPDFHFTCSQAQHYAWIEEDSPALFRQISERVRQGRWEPQGGMWIEPDCNAPSGESLIRQCIHGVRWWAERFGSAAPQRVLFLPDTFGFPASLPQIARLAGLESFVTNKISWCESNRFPHTTFLWRGLDGTELLTHLTPGNNYNSSIEPGDMRAGEANLIRNDGAMVSEWLQPFGFGDGGGGPTDRQIERARIAADCDGVPRFVMGRMDRFCERLHARRAEVTAESPPHDLPVWDGELYLELHRGTYTTQAWIKEANRRAESKLRLVEALACMAGAGAAARPTGAVTGAAEIRAKLDPLWKLVLLNQFHDILPGSSIAAVYEDAREQHARVDVELDRLEAELVAELAAGGPKRRVVIVNPSSAAFSGVVESRSGLVRVSELAPLEMRVLDEAPEASVERARAGIVESAGAVESAVTVEGAVTAKGATLRNEHLEAVIDSAGRVSRLTHLATGRIANAIGPGGGRLALNQLVLYEDRPRRWEAWDIDRDYTEKPRPITSSADQIRERHRGPLRGEIEVTRRLGRRSRITQIYRLDACSPALEVHTQIEWREDSTLLRALFPCDVLSRRWTSGIQFGFWERPTHRNTSWEQARFEVPGHLWMDLSEVGFGVSIIDAGKVGRSCHGGTLGLSLLRSPGFPDPGADRGEHRFRYAIMPHAGDWRRAEVDSFAEQFAFPPRVHALAASGRRGGRESAASAAAAASLTPFSIERTSGAAAAHISALKPAEDGRGVILRVVESRGAHGIIAVRWNLPCTAVSAVDLLERPLAHAGLTHEDGVTIIPIRPFQIVSLRASMRRPAPPRKRAPAAAPGAAAPAPARRRRR